MVEAILLIILFSLTFKFTNDKNIVTEVIKVKIEFLFEKYNSFPLKISIFSDIKSNINIDINMLKYNIILVAITFLLSTFIGFLFKYAPIMYNVINHNICEKCLFTLKIVGIILSITTSININFIVSLFSNVFNNLFIYGEKIYSIM